MGFMQKEDRENQLIEYDTIREQISDRDYVTWVVNSILIIGSLLTAFVPGVEDFPTPILSLVLVASAAVLHVTSVRAIETACRRLEELAKKLNLPGATSNHESNIADSRWYTTRRNVAYALYAILITVYSFLILTRIYI